MPPAELPPALNLEPYPGLRCFEPHEDFLFYGREIHTAAILDRLSKRRFLAVVGTSGSGKSSLVRAGLLPALYRGYLIGAASRWKIAVMRPGASPLAALARALAAPGVLHSDSSEELWPQLESSRSGLLNLIHGDVSHRARLQPGESLLIVVDQFEELFRFSRGNQVPESAAEAALFVSLLLRASEEFDASIYVVLTMRSDFLGDCTRFPGLAEALNEGLYVIPRLTLEQRQSAVERPLSIAGVTIAPRLVQRLLADAGDDPDQLPILQHALMRTWRAWQESGTGSSLDLRDYEKAGAAGSALNQHADEIYSSLDVADRAWAAKLFRCITAQKDGRPIRRPSRLRWIYAVTQADSPEKRERLNHVIRQFALPENSFLLSSTGDRLGTRSVIDISHESLIRKWERLKAWVTSEGESAAWLADVAGAVRRSAAPLSDPDLARVEGLKTENGWNACWASQYLPKHLIRYARILEYLRTSRAAQNESDRLRLAARRQERNKLLLTIFLLAALSISVSYNLYSGYQERARRAETEAAALAQAKLATEAQKQAEAAARQALMAEEALQKATTAGTASEKLAEETRAAQARAADLAKAADDATTEARRQAEQAELQKTQVAAALKQIADLQTQLTSAQQQVTRKDSQISSLNTALATAQKQASDLQAQLAQARSSDPSLLPTAALELLLRAPRKQTFDSLVSYVPSSRDNVASVSLPSESRLESLTALQRAGLIEIAIGNPPSSLDSAGLRTFLDNFRKVHPGKQQPSSSDNVSWIPSRPLSSSDVPGLSWKLTAKGSQIQARLLDNAASISLLSPGAADLLLRAPRQSNSESLVFTAGSGDPVTVLYIPSGTTITNLRELQKAGLIEITDLHSGRSMDADGLTASFDAFFRTHPGETRSASGTDNVEWKPSRPLHISDIPDPMWRLTDKGTQTVNSILMKVSTQ